MAKGRTVYQLKISLSGIKPAIWRRVQVSDCTLARLHEVIQVCMGWEGSHLWAFDIGDEEYGPEAGDWDDPEVARVKLSEFVDEGVKRFRYTYDFGDNWEVLIQVEKEFPPEAGVKYPRCLAGERAGPPEDCGGVWGYEELLEVLSDPEHEEHEDRREWVGEHFEPEAFPLERINKELARLR